MIRLHRFVTTALALIAVACAAAPKPTAASLKILANARAVVEGRVIDAEGHPVEGIGVRGIPHGKDIPWSPPVFTGADGGFRVSLTAPGSYGFLLLWKGTAVITSSPRDPARLEIGLEPGQTRKDIELVFLREEWERATGRPAGETTSSP